MCPELWRNCKFSCDILEALNFSGLEYFLENYMERNKCMTQSIQYNDTVNICEKESLSSSLDSLIVVYVAVNF